MGGKGAQRRPVQSGVYTFEDFHAESLPADEAPKRTSKTRGIRPAGLPVGKTAAQFLIEEVPSAWRRGDSAVQFQYRAYKTVGAAIASRASCALAGHWITGVRQCAIDGAGSKRQTSMVSARNKRARDRRLVDTLPADNPMEWKLSEPRPPEWLNVDLGERGVAETDALSVTMKGGYD
jgi:hypothetical protein